MADDLRVQRFGNTGGAMSITTPDGQKTQVVNAMKRRAQMGGGGVSRMAMAPFNPFIQNLDIPQDYALRNVYKRHFFKTNPIVGNAIELHAEFALSDFHLEHEDEAIEEFLNDMLQESGFLEMLLMASVEFWLIGELNWFSFFDSPSNPSCYTGFCLLDPNKLNIVNTPFVQGHYKEEARLQISGTFETIVKNGPNHPETGMIYKHLPSDMVNYCLKKVPMPLSPLQYSRMKRNNYFSIRGESILERIFPLLLYKDKLRAAQIAIADRYVTPTEIWKVGETGEPADNNELEALREAIQATYFDYQKCFHPSHECLTRIGWKHYKDLNLEDEIGTINIKSGALEYQKPMAIHEYDCDGELIHFSKGYNDALVTPNHNMLVQERLKGNFQKFDPEWKLVRADKIKFASRFKGIPEVWKGKSPEFIKVGKYKIPTMLYCALAGYYVSEGSCKKVGKGGGLISVCQTAKSRHTPDIDKLFREISKHVYSGRYTSIVEDRELITWQVSRVDFYRHFTKHYGNSQYDKKISKLLMDLDTPFIKEFLRTAQNGDGTPHVNKEGRQNGSGYSSVSKELVDKIQILCFKVGYPSYVKCFPLEEQLKRKPGKHHIIGTCDVWGIYWSYPVIGDSRRGKGVTPYVGDRHNWEKDVTRVQYTGKVWCVTTPNSTVVTRRNGRTSISGNSIIWHHALQYECVGPQDKIPALWTEFDNIDNEVCAGLLINKGLILGDASTFASDVVRYDILINRYMMYRQKVEGFIRNLLAPILKIHEIYVPESKVKSMALRTQCGKGRPLAYPTIRWDKQTLRDENTKLELMTKLVEKKLIPESTLIRMLNIDPKTAAKKVDEEALANVERKANLLKQIKAKGIPMTAELQQILGNEEGAGGLPGGGEMPTSIGGMGGGEGGAPSPIGGNTDETNELPAVVPGANEKGEAATAAVSGGSPGSPNPTMPTAIK